MEHIEKHMEIFRQVLDISETMEESMIFLRQKTEELRPDKAMVVLMDTSQALTAIETALDFVMPALPENSLEAKSQKLRHDIDNLMADVKHHQGQRTLEILEHHLEPSFHGWKRELDRVLNPYILQ